MYSLYLNISVSTGEIARLVSLRTTKISEITRLEILSSGSEYFYRDLEIEICFRMDRKHCG